MLLIVGTIRLPPENLGHARPVIAEMLRARRAEDGCFDYSYAEDVIEPGLIRVTELWRDQTALDGHFASPHIARWRAEWPRLGIGERNLRVYELSAPQAV